LNIRISQSQTRLGTIAPKNQQNAIFKMLTSIYNYAVVLRVPRIKFPAHDTESLMNKQLRVVVYESEKGFADLVQAILASEPGGPCVDGVFRNCKLDPRQIAAMAPDVVIVEATSRRPLDRQWCSALPLTPPIPILVCTPCALLAPPRHHRVQTLVMPFTIDELFSALAQLTGCPAAVTHPAGW
jgi:hypothetical protein